MGAQYFEANKYLNTFFRQFIIKSNRSYLFFFLFDKHRQSDQSVELNRLLERNLRQSNFMDFESLCIRAAEKVWQIRVDLNVLNNDGNMLDCANIALICSISNYRLPDVSVTGEEIKIVNSSSVEFFIRKKILIKLFSFV